MRKTRTLSADDRAAVDLLLDLGAGRGGVVKVSPGVSQARLSAATELLNLLDQMTVLEPPADLVARTVQAVEAAEVRTVVGASAAAPAGVQLH